MSQPRDISNAELLQKVRAVRDRLEEGLEHFGCSAPASAGISEDELLFLYRLSGGIIAGRLQAGGHPEDVLMSVWDLWEHTVRALIDGAYPNEGPTPELQQARTHVEAQARYIAALEEACAPSKLTKLQALKP